MRKSKNMVLLSMDRTRYMMRLRKDKKTLLGVDRPIQKDTPLFETLTTINITTETSKKNALTFNPQSSSTDPTTILKSLPSRKSIPSAHQTVLERSTSIYYSQICPQNITTTTRTTIPALMSTHIRLPTQILRKHHTFHLYRHTFIIKKNPNLDRFGNFSWIV